MAGGTRFAPDLYLFSEVGAVLRAAVEVKLGAALNATSLGVVGLAPLLPGVTAGPASARTLGAELPAIAQLDAYAERVWWAEEVGPDFPLHADEHPELIFLTLEGRRGDQRTQGIVVRSADRWRPVSIRRFVVALAQGAEAADLDTDETIALHALIWLACASEEKDRNGVEGPETWVRHWAQHYAAEARAV
ncbi:MAG: hypothetical protein AAGC63_11005 [Propionicimonas sp.]